MYCSSAHLVRVGVGVRLRVRVRVRTPIYSSSAHRPPLDLRWSLAHAAPVGPLRSASDALSPAMLAARSLVASSDNPSVPPRAVNCPGSRSACTWGAPHGTRYVRHTRGWYACGVRTVVPSLGQAALYLWYVQHPGGWYA
eukprot:scaffold75964_cov55-Phaeocystis_antarctica.AAC.2